MGIYIPFYACKSDVSLGWRPKWKASPLSLWHKVGVPRAGRTGEKGLWFTFSPNGTLCVEGVCSILCDSVKHQRVQEVWAQAAILLKDAHITKQAS